MADYAQDTGEILNDVNDAYAEHEDGAPWRDRGTVRMSAPLDELVAVLRGLSQDPHAYADLRAAHVRHCADDLAAVPDRADGPTFTGPARNCAAGLGYYDGIADDIPDAQSEQWRSDVLQRLKGTLNSPPSYGSDPAGHIAASWQQDVVGQVAAGRPRFLTADSARIVRIWATARGEALDSEKEQSASDARSRLLHALTHRF